MTSEQRRATILFGLAIYAVLVGIALGALSSMNEPVAGKIYRRGLEFGLELIALAWPVSLMVPQLRGLEERSGGWALRLWSRPEPSYIASAWIHWTFTMVVSMVFLFPRQLLYPLLDLFDPLPPELVAGAFGLLFLLAFQLLIGAACLGLLRLLTLFAALGPYLQEWRVLAYAVACGSAAAGVVAALMTEVGPAGWLRPPATLDPEVLGMSVIAAVAVVVACDYLVSLRESASPVADPDLAGSRSGRGLKVAIVAAAGLLWVGVADEVMPGGMLAPRVLVHPAVAERAQLGTSEFEERLRRISVRMGFDVVGETFRIEPMDGPSGFRSDRRLLPDGTVRIRIYSGGPVEETRDLIGFGLASAIAELRYWPLQRLHRAGYAYWASEPTEDPLRESTASWAAWSECDDVPRLDLHAALNTDLIAPSALPFLQAERSGGVASAQALLHDLFRAGAGLEEWRLQLLDACRTISPPGGEPPPLRVEARERPNGPPADGRYERRLLEEMKARAGLSDAGREFVIEYVSLPSGRHSISSFPDSRTIVLRINAGLGPQEREQALRVHFVADLVGVKYSGQVDPIRVGYATWASRDPLSPFNRPRPSPGGLTAAVLCDQVGSRDLLSGTLNDAWLSSVPFIDAERNGGEPAAQELLRESLRAPADVTAWRARITEACGRLGIGDG